MPTQQMDGISLKPPLDEPGRPWKHAALSQFPRPWNYVGRLAVMGYTVRSERWRYIEWQDFSSGEALACELFDYEADGNVLRNLAEAADCADILAEHRQLLRDGWRACLPPDTP